MKKLKLALIGCGYLNEIVANALKDGYLPQYELVAAMSRHYEHTLAFAEQFGCKACKDIDELLCTAPDFVAEAASISAVQSYAEAVLGAGCNMVVLSIGAFADSAFYEKIKAAATRSERRVYIASGAVGGFDILRTAALMSPITASISAQKSPSSLQGTALYSDKPAHITQPTPVFSGSVKEAIGILPTKVNVAVATALASAGVDKTTMNISAVDGFKGDEYKLELSGGEVRCELNIYSRTSAVAAWSVVSVLQNAVSPIVF